jgi:outer membrane biosynthesis protein TonB
MRTPFLSMAAAACLTFASSAYAAPSASDAYAERARAQAEAQLASAGVDLRGQTVAVRGLVGDDGLRSLRVIRSSGSREVDYAVEQALKKVSVAGTPPLLAGAKITLGLGRGEGIVQAKAP